MLGVLYSIMPLLMALMFQYLMASPPDDQDHTEFHGSLREENDTCQRATRELKAM